MNRLNIPKPRVLARTLALVLAGALCWGAQAHAASAPCKTSAQKASKACVQKDKASPPKPKSRAGASTQHKAASKAGSSTNTRTSTSTKACAKTKAAKRRCAAPSKSAKITSAATAGAVGADMANGSAEGAAAAGARASTATAASPCFAALASSQASQHMADKVPFLAGQAPQPEQLANAGRPSKKEQTELSSLIAGYQMCHDMAAPPSQSDAGSPALPDDAAWRAAKSVLNDLQAGRLSYGAAARALAQPGASAAP